MTVIAVAWFLPLRDWGGGHVRNSTTGGVISTGLGKLRVIWTFYKLAKCYASVLPHYISFLARHCWVSSRDRLSAMLINALHPSTWSITLHILCSGSRDLLQWAVRLQQQQRRILFVLNSVLRQEIGWEERLRNDLFCVGWDVKP